MLFISGHPPAARSHSPTHPAPNVYILRRVFSSQGKVMLCFILHHFITSCSNTYDVLENVLKCLQGWCSSWQQCEQLYSFLSWAASCRRQLQILSGSMMAMFRSFVSASTQLRQQQQQPNSGSGSLAAPLESVESQFSCPICLEVYHKPVSIASCAHT